VDVEMFTPKTVIFSRNLGKGYSNWKGKTLWEFSEIPNPKFKVSPSLFQFISVREAGVLKHGTFLDKHSRKY